MTELDAVTKIAEQVSKINPHSASDYGLYGLFALFCLAIIVYLVKSGRDERAQLIAAKNENIQFFKDVIQKVTEVVANNTNMLKETREDLQKHSQMLLDLDTHIKNGNQRKAS